MEQEENRRKKPKQRKHPVWRVLGMLGAIILVTGALLACIGAMYIKFVIIPESSLNLSDFALNLTTTVYYTDENTGGTMELQQLHGTENRIWIDYDSMPENLLKATVAIEDKRFYDHHGVDWIRTVRGMLSLVTGQDIQGGSTLTQQLIKNLTTENQVTVKRKIKEIFQALEFEKNYSKQEILEWYLNYVFFGEGCNGVYTASYAYFGKHVSELSLAECASIIGITNNPSLYNPYRNAEANKTRQSNILYAMYDQGKITKEEYDTALAEPLSFVRGQDESRPQVVYNWYVDSVIDEVIADLCQKYNYSEKAAATMVYSGGLQIYSNMKPSVQQAVESIYYDRSNLNYVSSTGQNIQSAITVVDNKTGHIVATAGGIGEKTGSRVLNRAEDSKRPPGSAMKPLGVYGQAMDMGLVMPYSVEVDSPYEENWPVNSYGSYRGKMTMTEAIRISSNTIAVKVLAELVTPEVSFAFLRDRLGFQGELVESRTIGEKVYSDVNLSALALGGTTDGVTTRTMAAAYSTFPRGGVYYEPCTYSRVLDGKGDVLLEANSEGDYVFKEKTAYYMNDMLQNVVADGTGKSANFSGMEIAGKTGTTSSKKDLWFVGYTPYYTAAVWTGYDQQEAMRNVSGNPSVGLFRQVMSLAHQNLPYADFFSPESSELVAVECCSYTGKLARGSCPSKVFMLYQEDVPSQTCNGHGGSGGGSGGDGQALPPSFDINDPSTWPNDEGFNPEDSATWPQPPAEGGETAGEGGETPAPNPDGGGDAPPPEPAPEPVPEPAPEPAPEANPPA